MNQWAHRPFRSRALLVIAPLVLVLALAAAQQQSGPVIVLRAGEPYYTQAGVPHRHGADPEQPALQFSVYSGTLDWQQPVTDEEYLGR